MALEDRIKELEQQKNQAYWERNQLVAVLSKIYPAWLSRHPESDESWEDDWRNIVFIQAPTGQCSWHIHDSELGKFIHLTVQENLWDGHSTEEKYKRLASIKPFVWPPSNEVMQIWNDEVATQMQVTIGGQTATLPIQINMTHSLGTDSEKQ